MTTVTKPPLPMRRKFADSTRFRICDLTRRDHIAEALERERCWLREVYFVEDPPFLHGPLLRVWDIESGDAVYIPLADLQGPIRVPQRDEDDTMAMERAAERLGFDRARRHPEFATFDELQAELDRRRADAPS